MAVLTVLPVDHPMLRRKASRVRGVSAGLKTFVDDMFETMQANRGSGLAATQVGRPWRVIVAETGAERFALINPEVVRASGAAIAEEGCLSLPNWYGPVERATDVTVKGLGLDGKPLRRRLHDLAARVVLHEIDHLDGVIFTDRLVDPEKLRFVDPRSPEAQDLRAS